MKVIVVGLGSMGKRRIRLLQSLNKNHHIIGIDANMGRREQAEKEHHIRTYGDLQDALLEHEIEYAFICTSPLSHHQLIHDCLSNNLHVFTELNLVSDGYLDNIRLAKERGKKLFLSSTFLFREETKKIIQLAKKQNSSLNYTYHVGQYLPDWHPWENYNDYFVGDKRTNGCREIFAIELPWLVAAFGEIESVFVKSGKMSGLNIDYADNYFVVLEHKSGHKGMLAVDVVSRKAVRNLEVFGESIYLSWDGTPEGLWGKEGNREGNHLALYSIIDKQSEYQRTIVENAYLKEIEHFFEVVEDNKMPIYSFETDEVILHWIDIIEGKSE